MALGSAIIGKSPSLSWLLRPDRHKEPVATEPFPPDQFLHLLTELRNLLLGGNAKSDQEGRSKLQCIDEIFERAFMGFCASGEIKGMRCMLRCNKPCLSKQSLQLEGDA